MYTKQYIHHPLYDYNTPKETLLVVGQQFDFGLPQSGEIYPPVCQVERR